MNAKAHAPVVVIPTVSYGATAAPEQRLDTLTKQLSNVASPQLRDLLDRQNELITRLNALANISDVTQAERQKAIIEADLKSTREEIAKRQENVGVLAAELMALYDELGLQAQKADTDSPVDETRRLSAQNAVQAAMNRLAAVTAAVTAAEAAVADAQNSWWPIGKDVAIAEANAKVLSAQAAVTEAEAAIAVAKQGVIDVETQIEIDRADRIRRSSLAENFALIRQFTGNAVTVLREDVEQTETRRVVTDGALKSALVKRAETARSLDALRDELTKLDRDLNRELGALNEVPDQGTAQFADQQALVVALEQQMTEKRGSELKLNTMLMSLTAAIEANKSSLAGLTTQRDTSEVYIIKLETAEKTAAILGHNIDRMIKNTTQETASDALDRAADKMTMTAVVLGIQAEVASAKGRNDAIKRHQDLMREMLAARDSGDQAMGIEATRYLELDAVIRAGYAERGVDIDMSHLQAAAEAFEKRAKPAATDAGSVSY